MQIGSAAEATGIAAKTIRYYESIGLISSPERTPSGYRDYTEIEVETLKFVQRARNLGFSIREVGELLGLWRDRRRASAEVKAMTERHMDEIERRIAELQAMHRTLANLAAKCHGDDRPDCPILDDLAAGLAGLAGAN